MNLGFWEKIKKPIMVLAPMADVTDAAFRRIIAKYSRPAGPDVFWTEFVSADGLMSVGRDKLLVDLQFSETERPIVAQLFGANPEKMEGAAKLVAELGFDGLDLNFGCPDRSIEKQGAGAAIIKNPRLAREIIRAAKRGVISGANYGTPPIPVSVKTRLGYNKDELDPPAGGWLPELLAEEPAVITIHARTRKEMSKVPARWHRIGDAVKIRDSLASSTLIFGNGDLRDLADAREKILETNADGAMLGRAIFGNPWLFLEG
ncbi:MAG: tRNA-dihydrouridine synthase family protein, partial [Patescibacteria group bacterium]